MVSLLSGMRMDGRNLIVFIKTDENTEHGLSGIKMDKRNVIISTTKEKETKPGQRGGPMATEKLKAITRRG